MKILALDSSGLVASVAVMEDDQLLGEYTVNYKKTHSQTLLPMLAELSKIIELDLNTIDAVAVSSGPGSFTGLRIGSATAKGLALTLNKPIVAVPTVDALACNLWGVRDLVCPLMDARRNQTYTGLYRFEGEELKVLVPQCAVGIDEITDRVNAFGEPVIFLGDTEPFREYLTGQVEVSFRFAPPQSSRQRAASVAWLGGVLYRQGKVQESRQHKPEYLRLSQAEREYRQKQRDFTV